MNIIGHGIDLVDIAEIQRWVEDSRNPLVARCFVPQEIDEVGKGPNRIKRIAGKFAAKEAVLKALSTGFGNGVAFTDVVILRNPNSPPYVTLTGGAAKAAVESGVVEWRLSISYTSTMAMASAIAISNTTSSSDCNGC